MRGRKRYRIHPGVAITAMVCLTALALGSQYLGAPEGGWYKVVAAFIIAALVGVKLRPRLPLT